MPFEEPSTIEPRRKRAKIVSACGECRRKKTKCNGEHPCRNCEKSGVACIYPMAQNDDKRVPSKQALEAIEERLKTIEDMLRTIIKTQHLHQDMDPAIHQFLHNTSKSSPTPPAITSPPLQQNRLPSIRSLSSINDTTTTANYNIYPSYSSTADVKAEEEEQEDYQKKRER